MLYWGKHLIINCQNGNMNTLNGLSIVRFSNRLVKLIDMKPYGKPHIHHFGYDNKKGWTLVQLIETSNITGHFCDDTRNFYLDIFSCKDYDEKVVLNFVDEIFNPKKMSHQVLYRDADKELR